MALASPKCWGVFCCSWTAFSPIGSLHGAKSTSLQDPSVLGLPLPEAAPSLMASSDPSQCQASAALHDQHYLGDPYPTKFGCQDKIHPRQPLKHSLCVLSLRKHFPEDSTTPLLFSSQSPLTSQLQLTSIDSYSNAKASLQWCQSLVNHGCFFSAS